MKTVLSILIVAFLVSTADAQIRVGGKQSLGTLRSSPFESNSLNNPFGAGNPYRTNGLLNPYSPYGSTFSNRSWTNPYATNAPKLYEGGKYRGRWSANPFSTDSTSNPFGRYGSRFSPDSINNPYGAGNPYSARRIYVYPGN